MLHATVHEPPDAAVDRLDRAEGLTFIGDRFTVSAALFAPLWLLANSLWLGLLLYVAAAAAILIMVLLAGLGPSWLLVLAAALHLIVGLEASSLRRWTLERRGWRTLGTVSGRNIADCERRFLDAWLGDQPRADNLSAAGHSTPLAAMADGQAGDAFGRRPLSRRQAGRWLPWPSRR